MESTTFIAPWDNALKIITSLTVILFAWVTSWLNTEFENLWISILPFSFIALVALFSIRGYQVKQGYLIIKRPLWTKAISLAELEEAEHKPQVMKGSLRVFGIGGLFSYSGIYSNVILGTYRAYVSNYEHTVVLIYSGKKIVVSPRNVDSFLVEIKKNT